MPTNIEIEFSEYASQKIDEHVKKTGMDLKGFVYGIFMSTFNSTLIEGLVDSDIKVKGGSVDVGGGTPIDSSSSGGGSVDVG